MIPIQRLAEPDILKEKKAKWTADYLGELEKDPKKKPRSKRYAHKDIIFTLEAMSYHKCFYCEQSTKETKHDVDHYIEVSERPELAYEWHNPYLSCPDCNRRKRPNTSIPVEDCLDPCDPKVRPSEHLCFDDEFIRARNSSGKGLKSIKKYNLNRRDLDYKRLKRLQRFDKVLDEIRRTQIADGRKTMTPKEIEALRSFGQADQPFSLMFFFYMERLDL